MQSILVRAFAVAAISVSVIPMAHAQKSDLAAQNFDRGKYEYEAHCAVCHGLSGAGDGSFAQLFKAGISMPDLTELSKKNNGVFQGKPVLIVLDYAETRTQEIVELASTTLHASVTPQVCLVLLARDGGDWWDHLADSAKGDQAVAAILRGLSSKTGPYRMNAEFIGQKDRPNAFAEALHDFAAFKGREPPIDPDIDLSENLFGDPLFIHLAALAYLRGQPSINDQELLGAALGHERSYWRRLLEEGHLTDLLPAFEQAVALFTLCGDRRTTKDAKALLGRTPRLQGADGRSLTQIFDILRRLYSIDGGLTGLQPDLLGETLVSEALSKDDELLDAAFGEDSDGETIRYALTVLTRLGRRVPAQQRWLKEALSRNLTRVSEAAMQVGLETGSPLPELYAEVIKDAPTGISCHVNDIPFLYFSRIALSASLTAFRFPCRHTGALRDRPRGQLDPPRIDRGRAGAGGFRSERGGIGAGELGGLGLERAQEIHLPVLAVGLGLTADGQGLLGDG